MQIDSQELLLLFSFLSHLPETCPWMPICGSHNTSFYTDFQLFSYQGNRLCRIFEGEKNRRKKAFLAKDKLSCCSAQPLMGYAENAANLQCNIFHKNWKSYASVTWKKFSVVHWSPKKMFLSVWSNLYFVAWQQKYLAQQASVTTESTWSQVGCWAACSCYRNCWQATEDSIAHT